MSIPNLFPPLTSWEPTRDTLHAYCRVVSAVPRALEAFHPRWWHISLKVHSDGLITEKMALPNGGLFWLIIELRRHRVLLQSSRGIERAFSMRVGLPATALGDQVLGVVASLGLEAEYAREKFESEEPRTYDVETAERYLTILVSIDLIFKLHRESLAGEVGPVQLWSHHFDLAFEWFGTRLVEFEEQGEVKRSASQLNLGFSPGDSTHPQPYFYSNPWPFEREALIEKPLPSGARWFTESWQGSILPYAELVDDPHAQERLLTYARAVHAISAPTLME